MDLLGELRREAQGCTRCALAKGRTKVVFGEGNPRADLMFIGEGPGRDEDLQGKPFVGRAGQLLTKMIESIGLTREEVYIANVVKCRPPENREPLPEEAAACRDFLMGQIGAIEPKIVCALGRTALSNLVAQEMNMGKTHGVAVRWKGMYLMPVYHPAAALRSTKMMQTFKDDFVSLKKLIDEVAG